MLALKLLPFFALAPTTSSTLALKNPVDFEFTGLTLQLSGIHYYIPPEAVGVIPQPPNNTRSGVFDLVPITIVTRNDGKFEKTRLEDVINTFSSIDDVFQDGFLHGIYIQDETSNRRRFCERTLHHCSEMHANQAIHKANLANGPYFMSSEGAVFEVYRIYSDTQGSFSETTIKKPNGELSVLPANAPGQSLAVAVPSRLYFKPTDKKPLAGVRLGIKDIYDVKGLKTCNGNRAWYNHYSAANETAPAVQNLINAGAIVVGKMKTSQFANGETATADWVDYHAPFNPRGDGYQDGSSSSTGPASGEASYPWLDITLGSDTGGSIRSPSQAQGLYGNRPSHGLVSMDKAMPLAPQFDTAGLFARDPRLWATAAKALYQDNITFQQTYPTSILTVGFPDNSSTPYNELLNQFLGKLTRFLSAKTTIYNVQESWRTGMPTAQALPAFLNNTYELLTAKEQAKLVRDSFYREYAKTHDGRTPHVNPSALQRWAFGDNDESTIEEVVAAKTKFMNWFNDKELPRDAETCSKHLLVYVPRTPTPKYRDTYLTGPSRPFAFSTTRLSVYSGAPDMVVPVGQVSYFSGITNHIEFLPVSVDIMAAKGCDGLIFSLVQDLHAAGIVKTVKTGRTL